MPQLPPALGGTLAVMFHGAPGVPGRMEPQLPTGESCWVVLYTPAQQFLSWGASGTPTTQSQEADVPLKLKHPRNPFPRPHQEQGSILHLSPGAGKGTSGEGHSESQNLGYKQ